MASSEAVVAQLLKLPPEEQLFFKFKDSLREILTKLDHFYFVIVSVEDQDPLPEAAQLLQETRACAAAQSSIAYRLVFMAIKFGRTYLNIIGQIVDPNRRGVPGKLAYGAYYAGAVTKEFVKARKEMVEFGQETVESLQKIPSMLSSSLASEATKKEFFNSENSQIVSELLRVINECTAVTKECISYYTMIERHLSELREAGGPFGISEQEAQLISERWLGFISSCYRQQEEVREIDNALGLPRPLLNLAGESTQAAASSSNDASHVKATTDDTESPTPAKPRKPTLLRCLISCFSIKLFTND